MLLHYLEKLRKFKLSHALLVQYFGTWCVLGRGVFTISMCPSARSLVYLYSNVFKLTQMGIKIRNYTLSTVMWHLSPTVYSTRVVTSVHIFSTRTGTRAVTGLGAL